MKKKTVASLLVLSILLFLPFPVFAAQTRSVLVSGEAIGMTIVSNGIIVTEVTKVTDNGKIYYPSADAGLRPGDIITAFNSQNVRSAQMLSELVEKNKDSEAEIDFIRDGNQKTTRIYPKFDSSADSYKLGLMVKDSASGIGTLTFADPETGSFAALGHAINDSSTGTVFPVQSGSIYDAKIDGAQKGKIGTPGQLDGSFSISFPIGTCNENNEFGIYGTISDKAILKNAVLLPVASQDEIKIGEAEIIATVDENGPQRYSIRITKISRQSSPSSKSMTFEVTDKNLIEKTGGIVQGMSGSPIIQNGKLIGAVTHVIISNPQKGYAIFAEWMVEEALEEAA